MQRQILQTSTHIRTNDVQNYAHKDSVAPFIGPPFASAANTEIAKYNFFCFKTVGGSVFLVASQ